MKTRNSHFSHIDSFKTLEAEKMRMYFAVQLSKRKIDLRMMELGMMLNPMRLVPFLFTELIRPLVGNLKSWFDGLFQGNKAKPESTDMPE
jgi:hypothetical protein